MARCSRVPILVGFLCLLAPRVTPGARAAEGSLGGTFTITAVQEDPNGVPDTDAFDHLVGVPIAFTLTFDSIEETSRDRDFNGHPYLYVRTSPAQITFTGDSSGLLDSLIATELSGSSLRFYLVNRIGGVVFDGVGLTGIGSEYFGFDISMWTPAPLPLGVDAEGYPLLGSFSVTDGAATLRRHTYPPARMTDYAVGPATYEFLPPEPVAVEPTTVGRLRTRFRTPD